jgi:acetylglutamate kinase
MNSLQQFAGRWFVFKIGGELANDIPKLSRTVGKAVKACVESGIKVAVVHGGGPQATDLSKRLGLETKQVAGQRITNEATLDVMKMALGAVGVNVAAAFKLAEVDALCTSGVSAGLVEATRRPPVEVPTETVPVDYGFVGDVTVVNISLLEKLGAAGVVTVVSCLAADAHGRIFNVNADTVATRMAAQLGAAKLILVSNVPGVLRDRNDATSRIAKLNKIEAQKQIASGVISGGMIPKVQESLLMLEEGVEAIHIVGLSPENAILEEINSPGSQGTVFVSA